MKKTLTFIKNKIAFLGAVIIAAIVGGATTAIVMAAIPDSGSMIHGCYRSGFLSNGSLRIIDSSAASCNGNETALNWSQSGGSQTAYAAFNAAGTALNTTYSKNITSFKLVPYDSTNTRYFVCLQASFTPRFLIGEADGAIGKAGTFNMLLPSELSTFQPDMVSICGGSQYNAYATGLLLTDTFSGDLSSFKFMLSN